MARDFCHWWVANLRRISVRFRINDGWLYKTGYSLAVTLAQHLDQNSRLAQQPPRGWLRSAQHAMLGAQHFSPKAKHCVEAFFLAVGENSAWGIFYEYAVREEKKKKAIRRRRQRLKSNFLVRRGRYKKKWRLLRGRLLLFLGTFFYSP